MKLHAFIVAIGFAVTSAFCISLASARNPQRPQLDQMGNAEGSQIIPMSDGIAQEYLDSVSGPTPSYVIAGCSSTKTSLIEITVVVSGSTKGLIVGYLGEAVIRGAAMNYEANSKSWTLSPFPVQGSMKQYKSQVVHNLFASPAFQAEAARIFANSNSMNTLRIAKPIRISSLVALLYGKGVRTKTCP